MAAAGTGGDASQPSPPPPQPPAFATPDFRATRTIDFSETLGTYAKTDEARQLLLDATTARVALLSRFPAAQLSQQQSSRHCAGCFACLHRGASTTTANDSIPMTEIQRGDDQRAPGAAAAAFEQYVGIVRGFVDTGAVLRTAAEYTWSNPVGAKPPLTTLQDAQFELVCVLYNYAVSLMWHAAKVWAVDADAERQGEARRLLLQAAGIFEHILTAQCTQLSTDARVIRSLADGFFKALRLQCRAQALETLLPAVIASEDRKDLPILLAEITSLYDDADYAVQYLTGDGHSKNSAPVTPWQRYVTFKQQFYQAYAHAAASVWYLASSNGGMAVKVAEQAVTLAGRCKAPKSIAAGQAAVSQLKSYCAHRLDRAKYENDTTHFQQVPHELPPLPTVQEPYAGTNPLAFELPPLNAQWQSAQCLFEKPPAAAMPGAGEDGSSAPST